MNHFTKNLDEIRIKGPLRPAIAKMWNKTYVISGSNWVEVPAGTTLEQIVWINTHLRKKKVKKSKYLTREMKSSRGDKTYWTTVATDGFKECTCAGFTYRRRCRHTEELFAEIGVK